MKLNKESNYYPEASYQRLLNVANKCLFSRSNSDIFNPRELNFIGLDYSIAALEAFINCIGYIICDNWITEEMHRKNFYPQLDMLNGHLTEKFQFVLINTVELNKIEEYKKLRNRIHHVYSHEMDIGRSACFTTNEEFQKQCADDGSFNIDRETAIDAYKLVENIIRQFIENAKNKFIMEQVTDPRRNTLLNNLLDQSDTFSRTVTVTSLI